MDMKRRRDMQIAYIADQSVMEEMAECRKILQKLNFADRSDFDGISETDVYEPVDIYEIEASKEIR